MVGRGRGPEPTVRPADHPPTAAGLAVVRQVLLVWLLVLVASAVVAAVAVVTTAEWLATGTDSAGRTAGPAAGVAVAGLAFSG